jgi:hypothetical protein
LGGLCLFAGAGLFGFVGGTNLLWDAPPSHIAELSASDAIDFRFPSDWIEAAETTENFALASADSSQSLFDPNPAYPLVVTPLDNSPERANDGAAVTSPAANANLLLGSTPTRPAPARPLRRSNAVLSEQQLAGIKKRLNLNAEQERYWPAIAAELRKMEYKRDQKAGAHAAVDMSKVNIEGLKSAGLPLVMSFSEDQRQELKSLAHLLGLEKAVSSF